MDAESKKQAWSGKALTQNAIFLPTILPTDKIRKKQTMKSYQNTCLIVFYDIKCINKPWYK